MPAFLLLLPLAACTTNPPAAQPPAAQPPAASATAVATASGAAPVAPAGQADVIDCGVQVIPQGGVLSETAMACVIDAAAKKRAARLQETRPTIEGDPIITTYAVRADGVIEVTIDATRDNFGHQGIKTKLCTGPVADRGMLSFAQCTPEK